MDYLEDEPTQPCTQPFAAIRQSEQDTSGILCILFPSSPAAKTAVAQLQVRKPECIFSHQSPTSIPANISTATTSDEQLDDLGQNPFATQETLSIALRYFPGPMDPNKGFCFGRNYLKCDIVIGDGLNLRRISNIHFRIFVNSQRVLMLEDLSTNGTFVDGVFLGPTDGQMNRGARMRQLSAGSEVTILKNPKEEQLTFIVRIPKYDGNGWVEADPKSPLTVDAGVDKTYCAAGPGAYAAHMEQKRNNPKLYFIGNNVPMQAQKPVWPGMASYDMLHAIGKGAFATVKKAIRRTDGCEVAVKVISRRRIATNPDRGQGGKELGVKKEVEILERLKHPNIVQYHECFEDQSNIYIVMEYIGGGDLNDYIHRHNGMSEDLVREVTRQVLRGIEYIHKMGISHRDLKPDNILLVSENPMVVKISDFGLAKMVKNEDTFLKTFCGTMLYLAPEVYPHFILTTNGTGSKRKRDNRVASRPKNQRRYNQAVDMWSLGVVVYVLLTGGRPPWEGKDQNEMQQYINTMKPNTDPIKSAVSNPDTCIDFLERLLEPLPAERMTEEEALRHIWLSESQSSESGSSISSLDMAGFRTPGTREGDDEVVSDSEDERQTVRLRPDDDLDWSGEDSDNMDTPTGTNIRGTYPLKRQLKKQRSEYYDEPDDDISFGSLAAQSYQGQPDSNAKLSVIKANEGQSPQGSSGVLGLEEYQYLSEGNGWTSIVHVPSSQVSEPSAGQMSSQIRDPFELELHKPPPSQEDPVPSSAKGEGHDDIDEKSLNGAVDNLKVSTSPNGRVNDNAVLRKENHADVPSRSQFLKATKILPSFMDTSRSNFAESRQMGPPQPQPSQSVLAALTQGGDGRKMVLAESNENIFDYINYSEEVPKPYWGKLVPTKSSLGHPAVLCNQKLISFGRYKECSVIYVDERFSKKHCALHSPTNSPPPDGSAKPTKSFAWFYHTASNPCWVNGEKAIKGVPTVVYDGDEITLFKDKVKGEFLAFRVCLAKTTQNQPHNGDTDAPMSDL